MFIQFIEDFQEHKKGETLEVIAFSKLLQQCFLRGIVKQIEVMPELKFAVQKKSEKTAVKSKLKSAVNKKSNRTEVTR